MRLWGCEAVAALSVVLTVIVLKQDGQDLTAVQLVSIKRNLRLDGEGPGGV